MATMYFAKFNINEEIYTVYDNESVREKLLNMVFEQLNQDARIYENRNSFFKFISLDKRPADMTIVGRIISVQPGTHSTYDPAHDSVIDQSDDRSSSYASFYFDVLRERIAFVTKRDFGHKQFIERFKRLVEECVPQLGNVEIFIEKNLVELESKLSQFSLVRQISAELIPPNGDKDEFRELFGTDADEVIEANIRKYNVNLMGSVKSGLNISGKLIRRFISGVIKGYGNLTITGKDRSDRDFTLSTDTDAPFRKPVKDSHKDSLTAIPEIARAGIAEVMSQRAMVIMDVPGEADSRSD